MTTISPIISSFIKNPFLQLDHFSWLVKKKAYSTLKCETLLNTALMIRKPFFLATQSRLSWQNYLLNSVEILEIFNQKIKKIVSGFFTNDKKELPTSLTSSCSQILLLRTRQNLYHMLLIFQNFDFNLILLLYQQYSLDLFKVLISSFNFFSFEMFLFMKYLFLLAFFQCRLIDLVSPTNIINHSLEISTFINPPSFMMPSYIILCVTIL